MTSISYKVYYKEDSPLMYNDFVQIMICEFLLALSIWEKSVFLFCYSNIKVFLP